MQGGTGRVLAGAANTAITVKTKRPATSMAWMGGCSENPSGGLSSEASAGSSASSYVNRSIHLFLGEYNGQQKKNIPFKIIIYGGPPMP
jgi:hypothetical protein